MDFVGLPTAEKVSFQEDILVASSAADKIHSAGEKRVRAGVKMSAGDSPTVSAVQSCVGDHGFESYATGF